MQLRDPEAYRDDLADEARFAGFRVFIPGGFGPLYGSFRKLGVPHFGAILGSPIFGNPHIFITLASGDRLQACSRPGKRSAESGSSIVSVLLW